MPDRQTRVVRIYGKDNSDEEGGSDCSDCWIDLEIIVEITFESGSGISYQKTTRHFEYEVEAENSTREIEMKRVFNPDDETQWIDIPTSFKITMEVSTGFTYQKTQYHLADSTADRETHEKEVIHNNIADEYLDDDDNPPSDPALYLEAVIATGDQDDSQRLDVLVIDSWLAERSSGFTYEGKRITLAWQDYPLMQEPLVPIE
jgi:hypothetical protein